MKETGFGILYFVKSNLSVEIAYSFIVQPISLSGHVPVPAPGLSGQHAAEQLR